MLDIKQLKYIDTYTIKYIKRSPVGAEVILPLPYSPSNDAQEDSAAPGKKRQRALAEGEISGAAEEAGLGAGRAAPRRRIMVIHAPCGLATHKILWKMSREVSCDQDKTRPA